MGLNFISANWYLGQSNPSPLINGGKSREHSLSPTKISTWMREQVNVMSLSDADARGARASVVSRLAETSRISRVHVEGDRGRKDVDR